MACTLFFFFICKMYICFFCTRGYSLAACTLQITHTHTHMPTHPCSTHTERDTHSCAYGHLPSSGALMYPHEHTRQRRTLTSRTTGRQRRPQRLRSWRPATVPWSETRHVKACSVRERSHVHTRLRQTRTSRTTERRRRP